MLTTLLCEYCHECVLFSSVLVLKNRSEVKFSLWSKRKWSKVHVYATVSQLEAGMLFIIHYFYKELSLHESKLLYLLPDDSVLLEYEIMLPKSSLQGTFMHDISYKSTIL